MQEKLMARLMEIITAPPNDAVLLAFSGEDDFADLDRLNLLALTDFKRSGTTVEMKFVDRVKLAELICTLAERQDNSAQADLLAALLEGEADVL